MWGDRISESWEKEKQVVSRLNKVLIFVLAFHFTMTLIYVSPLNNKIVNAYMEPLFLQNWKLFAPDPKKVSYTVYVSAEYTERDGEVRSSRWMDMTSPLIEKNHSKLFSEVHRPLRSQLYALLYYGFPDSLPPQVIKKEEKNHYYVDIRAKEVQEYRSKAFSILERYASVYVGEVSPQRKINRIKLRVQVEDTSSGVEKIYTTDWLPYKKEQGK